MSVCCVFVRGTVYAAAIKLQYTPIYIYIAVLKMKRCCNDMTSNNRILNGSLNFTQ